jgi:ABC-type antimicrobial peptide transport system permease subunit
MEEKKEVNKTRLIIGLVMALLGFFLITFGGGDIIWNIYSKIFSSATQPESWDTIMNVLGWGATGLGLILAFTGKK